jgi:hypothetical protein
MKIYDCFTFYNEFELLELRLAQHWDHVDQFVIVEADHTFQNQPKPFLLKDNWERFAQWHSKMRLITVESRLNRDPWANERNQREAILEGLADAQPDDMIIIGDVDEVLRANTLKIVRQGGYKMLGFRMPLFNFKLNYMLVTTPSRFCVWNAATRFDLLGSPEDFRQARHMLNGFPLGHKDQDLAIIEHAGWHWTYFGDNNFARTKIQGFAHTETNRPDILNQLDIAASIADGRGIIRTDDEYRFAPVSVDSYFPDVVKSHTAVLPATKEAWDFLPKPHEYLK